jgi:hypothetical protein
MTSLRTILNDPESTSAQEASTSSHCQAGLGWNTGNNGYYYLPLPSTTYFEDQPRRVELNLLPPHLGSSSLYDSSALYDGSGRQIATMYSGNAPSGQLVANWGHGEPLYIPSLLESLPISYSLPSPQEEVVSHEKSVFGCFERQKTPKPVVRLPSVWDLFIS